MLAQPAKSLGGLALRGLCLACLNPGLGQAEAGLGELLLQRPDRAVLRPLGLGCGVSGPVSLGHGLLSCGDGLAVAFRLRSRPGRR